jgi:(E)-4-hydroxy-3-methylbut-2-enyl-diphosphate synthase
VQAYRLLVQKLDEEGFKPYPLHLGVTEAGEAEDGRIKSAVGIGTLLEDGLGDTVRVSLTEAPEKEAPVARALIDRYTRRAELAQPIPPVAVSPVNPYQYFRRPAREVLNLGGSNVPRVIADYSRVENIQIEDLKRIGHFYLPLPDKWKMNDLGADYIYTGTNKITFMLPNGLKEIVDYPVWQQTADQLHTFPWFSPAQYRSALQKHPQLNFVHAFLSDLSGEFLAGIQSDPTVTLVLDTDNAHAMPELRRAFIELISREVNVPVVIMRRFAEIPEDTLLLYAATDCGGLLIDGLGDGIMLGTDALKETEKSKLLPLLSGYNTTSFGILQAARTRMSKTEYISCPSCGRTLFDLQETTAMIRKRTDHLKGVKIGIMGCIVNGPGEMADADYGYVGVGKGKIALYRGQNVIKKSVPAENAVNELIELIREDGRWLEPETAEI